MFWNLWAICSATLCWIALLDPGLLKPELMFLWQATADLCLCRSHSNTQRQIWLSLCWASGSWCAQVLFEPSEHLWWIWGLILNVTLLLLPSCWGFSFSLEHGVSFFGGIPHSPVDGCWALSCNFGVLPGEDEHTSFYSTNLKKLFFNNDFQVCSEAIWL